MKAAEEDYLEVARLLVASKAVLEASNRKGRSALSEIRCNAIQTSYYYYYVLYY